MRDGLATPAEAAELSYISKFSFSFWVNGRKLTYGFRYKNKPVLNRVDLLRNA